MYVYCLFQWLHIVYIGLWIKQWYGGISSKTELGLYENAEKIINLPVGIITALGTVMIPHISKIDMNEKNEIKKRLNESFELVFFLIFPIIFGILGISKDFSNVYFGNGFSKASDIMNMLTLTIIFAGIANVIRTNYLIPFAKDNIYVKSTIIRSNYKLNIKYDFN